MTDINECLLNNANCSHTCRNLIGSYVCQCPTGYRLNEDGHLCAGERQVILRFKTHILERTFDVNLI